MYIHIHTHGIDDDIGRYMEKLDNYMGGWILWIQYGYKKIIDETYNNYGYNAGNNPGIELYDIVDIYI